MIIFAPLLSPRWGDNRGAYHPELVEGPLPRTPWITSIALRGRFTLGLCRARQNDSNQVFLRMGSIFYD